MFDNTKKENVHLLVKNGTYHREHSEQQWTKSSEKPFEAIS